MGETSAHEGGARRWLPWLVGLSSVAAVVFVALHYSETRDFAEQAKRANGWWMLAAAVLQATTYLAQGQVIGCVARGGGVGISARKLYELSLAKLFVEQAVPSAGLSGTAVVVGVLEQEGMPAPLISTAVIVDLVSCWAAYAIGLAVALALVLARHQANRFIVITSVAFIVALTVLSWAAATVAGRPGGRFAERIQRFKPAAKLVRFVQNADPRMVRSRGLVAQAVGWQLAILFLDTTTLWALIRAVGFRASIGGVLASFMLSTALRSVESVPGGLGVFEATSVLTLKMLGIPVAAALSATLLYRGLSFWLPMIPGVILSHRLSHHPQPPGGGRLKERWAGPGDPRTAGSSS